jgi:hypothetical protein
VDKGPLLTGQFGQPDDGVFVDPDQPAGLADATVLPEVSQDVDGLLLGEAGIEQGCAFAFGEALLAGSAGEHTPLGGAVAEAHPQIVEAALAVLGALRVLAAEKREVVHGHGPQEKSAMLWTNHYAYPTKPGRGRQYS